MTKISTLALLALAAGKANAAAKSLADIKHVIMIMMENRSFQHVRAWTNRFGFWLGQC